MKKTIKKIKVMPRLPLEGSIDLTYRCNNRCLHCWLWIPDETAVQAKELTFDEIRRVVDEARAMGCRRWNISGGEPLLRHDFPEIFEYITDKAISYTLSTNGTLITPEIARLLKQKNGITKVSLYGATTDVYQRVTRNPSGFEHFVQGVNYLREAGAEFIIQLAPIRSNYHQLDKMISLAKRLSLNYNIVTPWLYHSSAGSELQNNEIDTQRLPPLTAIVMHHPDLPYGELITKMDKDIISVVEPDDTINSLMISDCESACDTLNCSDEKLFADCIESRRDFHIDPYGQMSWCMYIKDPVLRFDLRRGSFKEAWETFIPSCAEIVLGDDEWHKNCGSCIRRNECRWCAAYAFLETGRYSAPIPSLCAIAEEKNIYKKQWQEEHCRFFRIAGITACLISDINLNDITFKDELMAFAVDGPGEDNVTLRHYFELPDIKGKNLGQELYHNPPWIISRKNGTWFYRGFSNSGDSESIHRVAVFSPDHRHGLIYNADWYREQVISDEWYSLTLFNTDQIWLGPLLADRSAVMLHSAAALVNGQGLVFVGHSDAGKSTTMELLKTASLETGVEVEVLCDDRNIIRKWPDGWRVHGTWSHGDVRDVSPAEAPLRGVFFLEQAEKNEIVPLTDRRLIWQLLLVTLIRPMVTAEWWQKELAVLEKLVGETNFFSMRFDKSGAIVPELIQLSR